MDLKVLEKDITHELNSLLNIFDSITNELLKKLELLSINIQKIPSVDEQELIEVKYSWSTLPDVNALYGQLLNALFKLRLLNQYLADINLMDHLLILEEFVEHFLEFNRPWEVIDWRCFYKISTDTLYWFDNRKSLLKTFPYTDEKAWITILGAEVNERLRNQYKTKLLNSLSQLKVRTQAIVKTLDFFVLLKQLQGTVTTSFLTNMGSMWSELITHDKPTDCELAVLAYIVRNSIEVKIRNSFPLIITPQLSVPLGSLFGRLQRNGLFVNERPKVERLLNQLNEAVHGKSLLPKKDLILIKEEFKTILKQYGLDLPF